MSSTVCLRDVRRHDSHPASDIRGRDAIGMTSTATLDALEDRLRRSVGLRDVPTPGTLPARIARVNKEHGHARSFRLILDKGPKLPKGPARELSALLPSSPRPQAYPRQVFQGDSSLRAFGKLNKFLADYVVGVAGETLLLARQLLEAASSGVRALLLEFRPESPVAMPDGVDGLAATDIPVRVGGDVLDSEVHTNNALSDERLRVFDFARGEQIELATPIYEVGFPDAGFEQLHLPFPRYERDTLTSGQSPDAHRGFVDVPRQYPVIIGNRAVRFESPLAPLVKAIGVSDFRKTPDHHLSRQSEFGLGFVVAELLKRVLPERPLLPRYLGDAAAGCVGASKRILQDASLFLRWAELHLGHEFHILKIIHDYRRPFMDYLWRGPDSSPLLKQGASSEQIR